MSMSIQKERGTVLLTTLLVMGVMASLAVAILEDLRFAIKRAGNVQAYAQADWYIRGAEDFAASYLDSLVQNTPSEQLNRGLRNAEPIVFPVEGGAITLRVRDGGDCVAVNAMEQAQVQQQFDRLLTVLGWSKPEARHLTAMAIDWQDADSQPRTGGGEDFLYLGAERPYRTANTPFRTPGDLRALDGITAPQYAKIHPFICTHALPGSAKININALTQSQAPVLASLIADGNAVSIAETLIASRPPNGFTNLEQLRAAPALNGIDVSNIAVDMISYAPEHIWVEAEVQVGQTLRFAAFEFMVSDSRAQFMQRFLTQEAFRPILAGVEEDGT